MTTIQDNTVSSSLMTAVNGTKSTAKAGSTEATQDRFLTLLVSQMKNQDPLNPLDNAQVTSQLAQLSTVTGIDKLNTTLQSMMASFQSNQSLQAATMIGHGVLAPGKSLALADSKGIFGVDVTEPADNVQAVIRDAAGNAVHKIDLGAHDAGVLPLTWDGKTDSGSTAADGQYTIEVNATRGGTKTGADALAFGQVASVTTGTAGVKLNIPVLGSLDLTAIRQIL